MKIIELRFKNLNSLYGEWSIDFTAPEYVSNGIFAITGPTGAGKTTILDAICLALYGQTPRLSKITKSTNEIISRQTGECFAEVVFETRSGRFRCHWSQHRARKKADGELQNQKHEISNADSGEILEATLRGTAERIERETGMDFDRFTRSMLLAQGGFAAFLQAAPDERAPILEQITGTRIYSEISIRVHERQRDEREKLNLLEAEIAGIAILEADEEKEIALTLATTQQEEQKLAEISNVTGKAIAWLQSIQGLEQEITSLANDVSQLQVDTEVFQPEREELRRATSAAKQDGAYATLSALRKQQSDDQATLKIEAETLPELKSAAEKQAASLISAEEQRARVKTELTTVAPIIQKVRALDQKLADRSKTVQESVAGCHREAAKIEVDKQARLQEQKKRSAAEKLQALIATYLTEHAQDEWLVSNLTGVEEQLRALVTRQTEIIQRESEHQEAAKALEQATKSLTKCHKQTTLHKQKLEHATKALQQGQEALSAVLDGRLLREYRSEKDGLLREMAFLKKIVELEEYRAQLSDGKPCPLCGATEHPFAEGNVPIPDQTEQKIESLTTLITRAEELEGTNKNLEAAEAAARNHLAESEKKEATAVNDQKSAEKTIADLNVNLQTLQVGLTELQQTLSRNLQPQGYGIDFNSPKSTIQNLKSKMQAWQEQIEQSGKVEKQLAALDSELKRLDAIIETQSIALGEKQAHLETLQQELATEKTERSTLYGNKDPDHEEQRLTEAISQAEIAEKQARNLHHELQQKWSAVHNHVTSLEKQIAAREPDLTRVHTEFIAEVVRLGFADESQFLEARMSAPQREALEKRARALDERRTEILAREKDRKTRLALEIDKQLTDKTLEELEPQFKQYADALQELREAIITFKHKLTENAAAKERIQTKQAAIAAQRREWHRWEALHELIGSSDGKRYRNFAQGLTFEIMVGHANRQLQKMTDRYLLLRDVAQPLELNVVDNYQAGEIRSTKNLSGGESFIVSLALALGLSHMASKNVRVDSLFLDEGFGTLDDEALETSLETLAGLQQDGKLIGIISHVSALRERITTQITIASIAGGRSTLSGPGCVNVS